MVKIYKILKDKKRVFILLDNFKICKIKLGGENY